MSVLLKVFFPNHFEHNIHPQFPHKLPEELLVKTVRTQSPS